MNEELEVPAEQPLDTKHQVAIVVLGALAGYIASRLAGAGYTAGVMKYRSIRANRSE